MQKLRRLNFFDRHVVKHPNADVHPEVQRLCVACACGAPDQLWLGDRAGTVRKLDRQFVLSEPFQAFDRELFELCAPREGERLAALGCDAGPSANAKQAVLVKVYDTRGEGEPTFCVAHRVFQPRAEIRRALCLQTTTSLTVMAVGLDSGVVQLWRGRDLSQERPNVTSVGDESGLQVTAVQFLEQQHRTVLFVCTALAVSSWIVGHDRENAATGEVRALSSDPTGGASPGCSCLFPTISALLVARSEAIFAYDPDEGNMSAMPLEGEKMLLTQFKSYFAAVTADTPQASGLAGASPSAMPKQTVSVCLAYPHMRFIAYSAQFTDVTHVVAAMGGIFVLSRGGAEGTNTLLFELREKPLSEQLDILVKKRMFEWAADLALRSGAAPEAAADIHREHGDALFAKRAYDQALTVYMKTVDLGLPLEPSYVVEKFLDAQRISHVAKYLKRLHERRLAGPEHTALLLKCYTKLKDVSTLEDFLGQTPVEQYDPGTAIEVLEAAGYFALAASVAKKPEVSRHEDYIRITLEHFKSYSKIVEYIAGLPKVEAGRALLEHGRVLMRHAPREVVALVREVCGLSAEAQASPGAAAAGTRLHDLLPAFVGELGQLELLLRSLLLGPGESPLTPGEAAQLFPILLELMVRSHRELPLENEAARQKLHGEIMRLIRLHSGEEALASTLMLSQTYDFVDGFFHAAERLGRFQLLMNWCFEHRDVKRLLEVCKRCGQVDQSLWAQALSFLAADEGQHVEALGEVLRHIECSDLMPLLMVIETLQQSQVLTLGDVRPYLQGQFTRLVDSVEVSRGKANQDRQEIARMQQDIVSLRTQAQVFQNTKCFQCGLTLEVPAVHYFCGHSYHSYCVPADGGCPKCSSEALPKITLREQREAQARNAEDFFKYVQGSSGDKQIQAIGEWCKFGAFDAGLMVDHQDPEI